MSRCALLLCLFLPLCSVAQPDSPTPKAIEAKPAARYWTRETKIIVTAEAAAGTADSVLTCRNLAAGGHEVNLPVGSCAQMIAFQLGIHSAAQSVAWILARTGHPHLAQIPRLYLIEGNTQGFIFSLKH